MTMRRGGIAFPTPEQAALAAWTSTPAANAEVVEVTTRGERAEVVVDVGAGYRYWHYCAHGPNGWLERTSSNGPTPGWDDPSRIQSKTE